MVYIDSWERATGYDDETTLDGVACYLFGEKAQKQEVTNVNYKLQMHEAHKMGQFYPTVTAGNRTIDQMISTFYPVNGILFWDMYGKATHTVADTTQTIVNMTTTEGQKSKKKAFQQWDADRAVDLFGLVTSRIKLEYGAQGSLTAQQTFMGCKNAASSATPNAATLPDDSSNNPVTGVFNVFDSWTWNSTPMEKPISFAMEAQQSLTPYMKGGGSYYAEISEHNPVVTGFVAGVSGTTGLGAVGDTELWDDMWAGTKRTLTWKMLKGTDVTQNFEVTATNTLCHSLNPIRNSGEPLGWTGIFTCENVSIVVTDSVDDDFYTIKT